MSSDVQTICFWRGCLPHWEVVDGRYFVTLHLANSLPRGVAKECEQLLRGAAGEDYSRKARLYFRRIEAWLDAGKDEAWLGRREIAELMLETIDYYEKAGCWEVLSFVVMPNHLHLFFRCAGLNLSGIMRRFKQYTAREAQRMLNRAGKRFWQREWFDHWSRSAQEDDRIKSYMRMNPVRAGLVKRIEDWPWVK